ncbi:MAG: hypothetical protein ACE5EI_10895 [Thermodesulfobacteriota bacterium]
MKYRIEIFLFAVAVVIFGAGTVYNRTMPVFVAQVDFGEQHKYIGGFIILVGVALFYYVILGGKKGGGS